MHFSTDLFIYYFSSGLQVSSSTNQAALLITRSLGYISQPDGKVKTNTYFLLIPKYTAFPEGLTHHLLSEFTVNFKNIKAFILLTQERRCAIASTLD